jgi:putative transposase
MRPDEYPWSSYRRNAKGETSDLVTPHDEYSRLGRTPAERQAVYRDLFGENPSTTRLEEIRSATNGGYVLGSNAFKRAMARALGRRVEKGNAGRPVRRSPSHGPPDLLAGK